MFRHIFIFALFATCMGYCMAAPMPMNNEMQGPSVWPAPGSDADVRIMPAGERDANENVRIVSKIGNDLVVENNINLGAPSDFDQGFSGGANMTHKRPAPHGFNIWEDRAEMPLMHAEMIEDDGGPVLVMSKSGRQRANVQQGIIRQQAMPAESETEIDVDYEEGAAGPGESDHVKSWVVASGQNLRDVLQDWCDREGWDLVWTTSREYPVQASAVFKGRFLDVSSALVRNFSRANPTPYAKFYKGNRVVVISTSGGE
ncbi:MAG: toxin co-regulated pilus biosynthesis Q family protein [Alphaproteobacteria bacterium]|nr:toxin co-regulated pilus biosynthesis Q family protein [Alphaproteobacteria bacterium]